MIRHNIPLWEDSFNINCMEPLEGEEEQQSFEDTN